MTLGRFLSSCLLALTALGAAVQAAHGPAVETLLKEEGLGNLRLEQSQAEVTKLLGKPESVGKLTKQEADGTWVQAWNYPSKGLTLSMASQSKKAAGKTVASITATAPCTLATHKGVKIGSPEHAVRQAYDALADHVSPSESHQFVVGSVYGGIIFNFEHGKVSCIFFGAAAE